LVIGNGEWVVGNGALVTTNEESAIEMLYLTRLENCYDYAAEPGINPGVGDRKKISCIY